MTLATKRKSSGTTKKDLEAKIAELEGKLAQLSSQLGQKPAQTQTRPPPPPQQKPTQTSKPAPQQQAAPPVTLESVIQNVPTRNWHEQKTKTPGYVSENPRAWARRHPNVGYVPTQSWTIQKSKIPGYTAPSNQYFATKQRLAFHPKDREFTGYGVQLGHGQAQVQAKAPPPPPPPQPSQAQGKIPKGSAQASAGGSSKKEALEAYEREYLARLEQEEREAAELQRAAAELAAKRRAQSGSQAGATSSTRGSLPKGF
jgi:hypothetical protein